VKTEISYYVRIVSRFSRCIYYLFIIVYRMITYYSCMYFI